MNNYKIREFYKKLADDLEPYLDDKEELEKLRREDIDINEASVIGTKLIFKFEITNPKNYKVFLNKSKAFKPEILDLIETCIQQHGLYCLPFITGYKLNELAFELEENTFNEIYETIKGYKYQAPEVLQLLTNIAIYLKDKNKITEALKAIRKYENILEEKKRVEILENLKRWAEKGDEDRFLDICKMVSEDKFVDEIVKGKNYDSIIVRFLAESLYR